MLTMLLGSAWGAQMEVHFIDVGQGDATLLKTECGTILVDTGGEGNTKDADDRNPFVANDVLIPYLAKQLTGPIDLLVITHPHLDHLSGTDVVLERFGAKQILDNGQNGDPGENGKKGPADFMRDVETYADANKTVRHRRTMSDLTSGGQDLDLGGALSCVRLTQLWSSSHRSDGHWDNANNHSVVLRVVLGESAVLLTGDLEEDGIRELVSKSDTVEADVYKVGHHGSHNGTTRALIEAVDPQYAVLSMGPESRHYLWTAYAYGHPRAVLMDLLDNSVTGSRAPIEVPVARAVRQFSPRRVDKAIYATAWDGDVVFTLTDAGAITVKTSKTPAP